MRQQHRENTWSLGPLFLALSLLGEIPCSVALAQAPITPSGLNTQVTLSATPPPGHTQYDITGGTRPGGGVNLFHSFGNFNVPNNNIANFLNDSGLVTSNILGRVTGGNISNIFGTIQTTGFGNANLFLMNPAGFLFGPNATLNVGGMVTFTSADYLRLTDGARFNAIPNTSADALLSTAPVAAFGFLGSNPGAITVQGSQFTVTEGTGISLVGGNITMQAGTLDNGTVQSAQLSAPSGQVNLVSVGKPSKGGGEVVIAGSGQGSGFTPSGFATLGTVTLSQGSTVDISGSPQARGVLIRGGQFIMDDSAITAFTDSGIEPGIGSPIEVTAQKVVLSNHSLLETGGGSFPSHTGPITFNVASFSANDSTIRAQGVDFGGAVTIQGLQGPGTSANSASLTNSIISTHSIIGGLEAGPILIRANNIVLNQSSLLATGYNATGGPITLVSSNRIDSHDSRISSFAIQGNGGTVDLRAGTRINLTGTNIDATGDTGGSQGTINLAAPSISLSGSRLYVAASSYGGLPGTISLTGTKAVKLSHTVVDASNYGGGGLFGDNGGALFSSHQSTISATSASGHGGTIHVQAAKVRLTDTQISTSVFVPDVIGGGPQTAGGTITVDAQSTTLTNSQILSTETEGQGGTINITSPTFHQDATSVIDASSQTGTDGTVTINGVIQP